MDDRPVQLLIGDDLVRSRASVFFRLLLALPHLIWLWLWGIAAFVAVVLNWFAVLVAGRPPAALHAFLCAYVRYAVHVGAYLTLAADPFPGFLGRPGYPIDVQIAPPARQSRWKAVFRLPLAIPALLISGALVSASARTSGFSWSFGLASTAAFLGWFTALARGRMPAGLRDAIAYALSYSAQLDAYLFLLTDRYPCADPLTALPQVPARREDPIRLGVRDELLRTRASVFFRLLLAIPHLIWLSLWGILAQLAAIANWLATLVRGQPPAALHSFLADYVRYQTHVYAYLCLIANPFPGFLGRAGSYPVDPSIAAPLPQNRWSVGFRLVLAVPVALLQGAYRSLLIVVALLGWFAALATGRMPRGLRNAGALALRYGAQSSGYLLLLTDSYPYSGPTAFGGVEDPAHLSSAQPRQ